MCLGVKSFALAMNGMFRKLGWLGMRWLVKAAGDGCTGQFGAPPDSHCALSGARHVSATVRVRSS